MKERRASANALRQEQTCHETKSKEARVAEQSEHGRRKEGMKSAGSPGARSQRSISARERSMASALCVMVASGRL